MKRIKTLLSILLLIITLSSCGNKKSEEKTNSSTDSKTVELPEINYTQSDIAKYTISAIMNQPTDIISVKENEGIYYVSYTRKDDSKKSEYKIKISGNKVIWGNKDGRWRDSKFDENINYFKKNNLIKIVQTFSDGSQSVKEFKKVK
jgi:hypothetical protein